MKPTWEESADLKMAFKHDPVTTELRAERDSIEFDEACEEVLRGFDTCDPQSLVAEAVAFESQRTSQEAS